MMVMMGNDFFFYTVRIVEGISAIGAAVYLFVAFSYYRHYPDQQRQMILLAAVCGFLFVVTATFVGAARVMV